MSMSLPGWSNLARRVALVLSGGLALSACQRIETSYCEHALPSASAEVEVLPIEERISQRRDARTLGDVHGHDGEEITFGLTTSAAKVSAQVNLHVIRLPGVVCARPAVHIALAYVPMQVEIANDLAAGSCAYDTVLGHERKHEAAYRANLASAAAHLRTEIPAYANARILYPNLEAASAAMQKMQDDWLVPRAYALLSAVNDDQAAVDSAEEYARVRAACPGSPISGAAQGGAPNPL